TTQEVDVAPRGVLGRELDVVGRVARATDRVDRELETGLAGHAELVLEVKIGSGDEGVDAAAARARESFGRLVDVARRAARQRRHDGPANRSGDLPDRLRVVFRRNRKARFDDVDAQPLQL